MIIENVSNHSSVQSGSHFAIQAVDLTRDVGADDSLRILDHVSLDIAAGETIAILGASGSGKSTLLGLMAGLDQPTSGAVFSFGECISALTEDQRAQWRSRSLGFVFQSFHLLPHLTALENVMLPLELEGEGDAENRALDMLGRVGLSHRAHYTPRTLSGGEQQRVALARAFVKKPPILFADEPTGSLDVGTGKKVVDLMFEMNRDLGATLVLVTHDPVLAQRCDRQIELTAGRIPNDPDL